MTEDVPEYPTEPLLPSLRQLQTENREAQTRQSGSVFKGLDLCQEIHLLSFEVARATYLAGVDQDFMLAYMLIISRTVQLYESIMTLAAMGHYGPAFGLVRGLLTDFDTLRFINLDDSLPSEWIELSRYAALPADQKKSNPRIKELQNRFRDSETRKRLAAEGFDVFPEMYGFTSEALHSTTWGAQFFGKPDWDKRRGVYEPSARPLQDLKLFIEVMSIPVAIPLQLVEILLNRPAARTGTMPYRERLARQFKRVARRFEGEQRRFVKRQDLVDLVWSGEVEIPEDEKDWPESQARAWEVIQTRARDQPDEP